MTRQRKTLALTTAVLLAVLFVGACSSPSESDDDYDDEYGAWLTKDQTLDRTRNGFRLILHFDESETAFVGNVENVGNRRRQGIEVEVYLSSGREIETGYFSLAPGQSKDVRLAATARSFDRWRAYVDD